MKVLFAVSNEEISESIVKRYQKDYKEIISYKNVYYFNAILKELQKDKNYDRIVISEELEAFTNTQYSQIDKFIFDKLDSISDEASNVKGDDIPIILICSDRREKSEEMLVKLFGIGIYNALIGNDRSVNNVCNLLNKPRLKKEAKVYYKIEAEDVTYQSESENDVSEMEIQNILAHYKRLGKDEQKYVDSFDNIASQYNDIQLKVISKFLPLNVRAVLEEKSPRYQELISVGGRVSTDLRVQKTIKKKENTGTSEKLLKSTNNENVLSRPVVIPSSVNANGSKKFAKPKVTPKPVETIINEDKIEDDFRDIEPITENIVSTNNEVESSTQIVIEEKPKRGRGRPRKNPIPEQSEIQKPKRGRGRPRKNPIVEEVEEPETEINQTVNNISIPESYEEDEDNTILPGFDSIQDENDLEENEESAILPGFEEDKEDDAILPGFEEDEEDNDTVLPGFEENEEDNNAILPRFNDGYENKSVRNTETIVAPEYRPRQENINNTYEDIDISELLTPDKKIVCFIGTSKNGTSFIVNNLAKITSQRGIDTAILDMTKNRNAFYIYTKNEEELRRSATESIRNLSQGVAKGISVDNNLTVYTSLPDEIDESENVSMILQTLLRKHSLVLIDCDFSTPMGYFEKAQEIYLVQTFDILTIQPLTAFLRDLKSRNILDERKLRVVLNKALKIRGINDKNIIGGMANYNDPAMSFMTELFNKNTIKYIVVPFNEEVYNKYLEGIINCEISIKGYPKNILQILNELSNMVYSMNAGRGTYAPPRLQNNGFSPSMNSTLDQMKRRY